MFDQETQSSWLSQWNIEYRCVSIWHRPTNASINYTMIVAQVYRYIYTHTYIYNMMYIYIYIYVINNVYIYMRPRGKGRKRAWQGAWHENTKGTAQLRSFFVNVDERV